MDNVVAWVPRGFIANGYHVKSCGNAHAWCAACRPEQLDKLRKPKPPKEVYSRPCRNCGLCDACLGISAPEGMKVCRKCGETKPVAVFSRRSNAGNLRNSCNQCRNGGRQAARCVSCAAWFGRKGEKRTQCAGCRPPLRKACARCGHGFVGTMDQRRYCSAQCRDASTLEKRARAHEKARLASLAAYGGPTPSCACCGEGILRFLAIDHIEGGGGQHRRKTGGGGFYSWLKKNGYPGGFRILCHNCNFGRQLNGGVCPHDVLVRELVGV